MRTEAMKKKRKLKWNQNKMEKINERVTTGRMRRMKFKVAEGERLKIKIQKKNKNKQEK